MTDSYKIKFINAIVDSSYTIFLDDHPGFRPGGKVPGEEFEIEISSEFTGSGKVKVFGRVPSRTTQHIAYSIPINLKGEDDQEISLSKNSVQPQSKPEPKSQRKSDVVGGKKLISNKLQELVQKKKTEGEQGGENTESKNTNKKLIHNTLQETVQKKKDDTQSLIDSEEEVENNENDTSKSSFWDKLR